MPERRGGGTPSQPPRQADPNYRRLHDPRASVEGLVANLGTRRTESTAPGVEANARLTALTGLLLLVMLAAEGLTIVSIRPLLSWHVAIGFALLPPVALKLATTMWRFSRYYLGDRRYRQAGPPPPLLRLVGPLVILSTVAVLASGVALVLSGGRGQLLFIHQASFVVWFGAMTLHVLGRVLRAGRLAAADLGGRSAGVRAAGSPFARQGIVLLALAAGVVVALATRGLAGSWLASARDFHLH